MTDNTMPCTWPLQLPAPSLEVCWGLWKLIQRGGWRQSWESLTSWCLPISALFYCHRQPVTAGLGARLWLHGSCLATSWPSCYSHHPVTSGTGGLRWLCSPHKALGSSLLWTFPACIRLWPHDSRQCELRRVYDDVHLSHGILGGDCCCLPSAVQPENLCVCPCPVIHPSLHPHTLPASDLSDIDTAQQRALNLCGFYIFLNKMHFMFVCCFVFLIKFKQLKFNHGPSS